MWIHGTDEVSAIGLGCMGITHASGAPMSIEDGAKVMETAHNLGYTLFDTAECYTGVYPQKNTVDPDTKRINGIF